jgi:hypothetical protein
LINRVKRNQRSKRRSPKLRRIRKRKQRKNPTAEVLTQELGLDMLTSAARRRSLPMKTKRTKSLDKSS